MAMPIRTGTSAAMRSHRRLHSLEYLPTQNRRISSLSLLLEGERMSPAMNILPRSPSTTTSSTKRGSASSAPSRLIADRASHVTLNFNYHSSSSPLTSLVIPSRGSPRQQTPTSKGPDNTNHNTSTTTCTGDQDTMSVAVWSNNNNNIINNSNKGHGRSASLPLMTNLAGRPDSRIANGRAPSPMTYRDRDSVPPLTNATDTAPPIDSDSTRLLPLLPSLEQQEKCLNSTSTMCSVAVVDTNQTMTVMTDLPLQDHQPQQQNRSSPIHALVKTVVDVVENVQEQHRRAKRRSRISQTLLTLRAAAEVHFQQQQQQRLPLKEATDNLASLEHQGSVGDLGSALFCPLDDPALLLKGQSQHCQRRAATTPSSDSPLTQPSPKGTLRTSSRPRPIPTTDKSRLEDEKKEEDASPVIHILPESGLATNPRLLTDEMFQLLVEKGVPECFHMHSWERIFSIGRDGDSFRLMLDKCAPYRHTIMVVQTTSGYLLGGFVSEPWQEQDGYKQKHAYYGTGVSFLFASHPAHDDSNANTSEDRPPLTIFPWTGSNDYCQICDLSRNVIAMGGAGAFGFILEDDLCRGATDRCGTFDNPPLTPDKDGSFAVASMEIYGLVPLFAPASSPTSMSFSLELSLSPVARRRRLCL